METSRSTWREIFRLQPGAGSNRDILRRFGGYFPPVGTRRRNSSKKFSKKMRWFCALPFRILGRHNCSDAFAVRFDLAHDSHNSRLRAK
jgi:hypothetical protein